MGGLIARIIASPTSEEVGHPLRVDQTGLEALQETNERIAIGLR